MIVILQATVDYIFSMNPTGAVEYFKSLGIPQIKETTNGTKYYTYL
jgi:hypothetical protein